MGQTCCNYAPKDAQLMNLEEKSKPQVQGNSGRRVRKLDPATKEQLDKVLQLAKKYPNKIVRIQALVRGYLVRSVKSQKKQSELEQKISSRSSKRKFKGGGMIGRSAKHSGGLIYAKQL